jgi:hypothetical protein
MMNFWISLYVTIVIVVSGSIVIGSESMHEQGSKTSTIASQNLTQDREANLPTELLLARLTGPDEQ